MEYATQAAQPVFPGNYMNQNSHPGYPHMGPNNDIASQVRNRVSEILPGPFTIYKGCSGLHDHLYILSGALGAWVTWNVYASWLH
jgi:hypothetical protein